MGGCSDRRKPTSPPHRVSPNLVALVVTAYLAKAIPSWDACRMTRPLPGLPASVLHLDAAMPPRVPRAADPFADRNRGRYGPASQQKNGYPQRRGPCQAAFHSWVVALPMQRNNKRARPLGISSAAKLAFGH